MKQREYVLVFVLVSAFLYILYWTTIQPKQFSDTAHPPSRASSPGSIYLPSTPKPIKLPSSTQRPSYSDPATDYLEQHEDEDDDLLEEPTKPITKPITNPTTPTTNPTTAQIDYDDDFIEEPTHTPTQSAITALDDDFIEEPNHTPTKAPLLDSDSTPLPTNSEEEDEEPLPTDLDEEEDFLSEPTSLPIDPEEESDDDFLQEPLPTAPEPTEPPTQAPSPTPTPTPTPQYPTVPPNILTHERTVQKDICSWKDEAEGLCQIDLKDDLRVGIITYFGSHDTKVEMVKRTWAKDYLLNKTVFIISDLEDKSKKILNSGCPEGVSGLCCKSVHVYKTLYASSPTAKWYLRAMDDTYVHLPNMLEYLSQYDENVPLLIGYRQVISPKNDYQRYEESQGPQYRPRELFYPQGGSGWVLSNAFMKLLLSNMDGLYFWFERHGWLDDVAMGEFAEKHLKMAMLTYKGFSNNAWTRHCDTTPECGTSSTNLTFVTFHARKTWQDMGELHKLSLISSGL